jgi:hypothetical protein
MTKQQQNDIILSKLADKLGDQPNVQSKLDQAFSQWFQNLAQQGFAMSAPPPAPEEEAPVA